MIKIAGTLPVKSRLPLSAWLLAALVTLVSFTSSLIDTGTVRSQSTHETHADVRGALAQIAEALAWPG
jgi:hypothetical protein